MPKQPRGNQDPVLAELAQIRADFLKEAYTVQRNRVSFKSHHFYAPRGHKLHEELRHAFQRLVSQYDLDVYPSAKPIMGKLHAAMDAVDASFPANLTALIAALKDMQLSLTRLRVAVSNTPSPKPVVVAQEFLPEELLADHLDVYQKILHEINICYEPSVACYNGCAVLIRRLTESLIIEAFIASGGEADIKDGDGNFLGLKALIGRVESGSRFRLGRESVNALGKSKFFGDLAAHNPRARVRKADLDAAQNGIRVAFEELATYSKISKP